MKTNKFGLITALLFSSLFVQLSVAAQSLSTWYLPQAVTDKNAQISFDLETTWHDVHGKTSGLEGKVWLADPNDSQQVNVELSLPVSKFDTDNSSRDETLREVMNEPEFKHVIFKVSKLTQDCKPELVTEKGPCLDSLLATLKIRDIEKNILVPVTISSEPAGFLIKGNVSINWSEYGVEDPSIFLIASVDPVVKINFQVLLSKPS